LCFEGGVRYKNFVAFLLSLYGGLFGVVFVDLAIRSMSLEIEDYFTMNGIFVLSFVILAVMTFYGVKNYLTKSSGGREKRVAEHGIRYRGIVRERDRERSRIRYRSL
jgi:hypothetical protein